MCRDRTALGVRRGIVRLVTVRRGGCRCRVDREGALLQVLVAPTRRAHRWWRRRYGLLLVLVLVLVVAVLLLLLYLLLL